MAELVLERQYYYPGTIVGRVVNAIMGFIEFLLAIRLILELLGADTGSQFIAWFYSVTDRLVAPFAGAFPALTTAGGSVIDFSIILAMVSYAVLGWLLLQLLVYIFFPATTTTVYE